MDAAVLGKPGTPPYGSRREPGYARSFVLAFVVHALLIAVLFLGVRMQNRAPESISVELWEPPPAPRAVEPPPLPKPEAEPPKPEPEPKIEKPDIVEKPAPKPEPKKPEPKPKPKPEPVKPKPPARDLEAERTMREELARENAAEQERQLKALAARAQASARDKALAEWVGKIRSKIRGNIPTQVVQDVGGNPEAVFDVALLPTGEVLTVRMRKSSGNRAYDEAIERAILKASPLPRPDQPSLFRRDLELKFRPLDQ
jgi:colicin import membrane protein